MNRDAHDEVARLISALLDDRISAEEHARLEAILKEDVASRRLYMQMVDQEIELPCLVPSADAQAVARHQMAARQDSSRKFARASRLWRCWLLGGGLAFGLAMFLVAMFAPPDWFKRPAAVPHEAPPAAAVRDSWAEDFESGQSGLWYGRMVTTNLPPGSRYGLAAIAKHYSTGDHVYAVQLPEDWNQGLVALTPESTLNVTYRLGRRTHVNVFTHTIPARPSPEREYEMYQLRTSGGFPGRSGRWQTAAIPFANFVRKVAVEPGGAVSFAGGPPEAGELITTLAFASVEPSDLVIDRVWIAPTGSQREEIVPLQNQRP